MCLLYYQDIKDIGLDELNKKFILVLTTDPDHGKTEHYRKVFTQFNKLGLKWTIAVFNHIENDNSQLAKHCYKGETNSLEDKKYREFILGLKSQRHEIAWHGYSQISNSRDKFIKGLEEFKEIFDHYPFTYIEHGGHPQTHNLGIVKKETLAMNGKNDKSKFYIEDIIKERIGVTWTREYLLDNYFSFLPLEQVFEEKNGITFLKRQRMWFLEGIIKKHKKENKKPTGVFIGYTHIGYKVYGSLVNFRKWNKHKLEIYFRPVFYLNLKFFEKLINEYEVVNLTIKELYSLLK